MRLIIAYKFARAPVSLALAIALTFAPARAFREMLHLLDQMSELGWLLGRGAHWLRGHLNQELTSRAAMLAWLDGVSTAVEGVLLWTGKGWAEWVVVGVLACLVPFELVAFIHKTTPVRFLVLFVNVLVVLYLAWRRLEAERKLLHERHERHQHPPKQEQVPPAE
jgi:uncharacterized membrane protein (DUF2068 family)